MLYLDDFIDEIEDLPNELKDMLITIRELDLHVQNALDNQNKQTNAFLQNARKMKPAKRDSVFQSLMTEFGKIVENADEKVNVADRLYELLVKRLAQLDREIAKFKIDLEADNPGVTAAIEEKVLKSDDVVKSRAIENKPGKSRKNKNKRKKKRSTSSSTASSADGVLTLKQQVKKEAVIVDTTESSDVDNNDVSVTLNVQATILATTDTTYDPARYCLCNEVSYGDMIACDNKSCPHEWFHYPCVDLTTAPDGDWYCPKCTAGKRVSARRSVK